MTRPDRMGRPDRIVVVLLMVTAGAVVMVAGGCTVPDTGEPAAASATDSTADTELATVTRSDVVEQQKAEARVGHGAVITLPLALEGTVTDAPDQGSLLRSGDVIVEVGGRPVVLVVGESPLYRPLRLIASDERDEAGTRLGRLTGTDVEQLQRYLLAEGHDDKGRLSADGEFGLATRRAVKDWQRAVGHPATGVVDTSQMLFMTTELLVASDLTVGQTFERFDVTGTDTVLVIVGSTTLREFFAVGSVVEVLADPKTSGTVTRSTRISGETGVEQLIEISVDGEADDLGQAVEVVGSIVRAESALTVPVRALLAVSDGGWVVEVDNGTGVRRTSVDLIDVVDTTAIVTGVSEGDRVVVPL